MRCSCGLAAHQALVVILQGLMPMNTKYADVPGFESEIEDTQMGGSNFLVSAVLILRRQKKDLQSELHRMREKLRMLETQNAAFLNVSADRLLERRS